MICVLALDLAKNRSGWALGGPTWNRPHFGVFETANWDKRPGYNLVNFRKFLDARTSFPISHVVIEQVFVDVRGAGSKAFNFGGTQFQMMASGVVLEWAESRGIKQLEANVGDWRARFLGHNRRPKDAAKEDLYWKNLAIKRCAELGWWVEHHDTAEALGILDFSLAALDPAYRRNTDARHARIQQDRDYKKGMFVYEG